MLQLTRLCEGFFQRSERRSIAYVLFAAVYVVPTLILAQQKLIWDDEFFTLYISKSTSWSEIWRALTTGADQHPPSFYYLTHLVFKLVGTSHITLRSTAIVGFGFSCICLYEITRRLIGPQWAIAAMLVPLTAPALAYAIEARGYGLELGFVAFALWMWLLAIGETRKPWMIVALAIGLCLAVASHYYAILILLPLGAGEIVRTLSRRRLDIPVACAFLGAFVPLIVFLPVLAKARNYSTHFWAVPSWGQMLAWYPSMLGRMPLLLLAAAGLVFLLRMPPGASKPTFFMPTYLTVATVLLALLPAAGMLVAQFVTRAFYPRYFIAALPGVVIIVVWGLRRLLGNSSTGLALTIVVCLLLFVEQWRDLHSAQVNTLQETRSIAALLRRAGEGPIIMEESTVFDRLSFYAKRDLVNKLVFTLDPYLSVRYLGHDTIDRGLLALAPWFPIRVSWWHDWWNTHDRSLVYGYVGSWNWLAFRLNDIGNAQLQARDLDRLLFSVVRTTIPKDDRLSGDPVGKPSLFDELPTSGPPLCEIYMPDENCPVIDDPKFPVIVSYPEFAHQ